MSDSFVEKLTLVVATVLGRVLLSSIFREDRPQDGQDVASREIVRAVLKRRGFD